MESTIGSSSGFAGYSQGGGKGGAVKPPLYVPTKREPSNNNRRSTDRKPMNANLGGDTTADGYVSKTGFSSLNMPPRAPSEKKTASNTNTSGDQPPYEQFQ